MTVSEIFSDVLNNVLEGVMLHEQLTNYFDFLNMHGLKRLHEYHYLDESANMRGLKRYYINHYNMLPPVETVENPNVIPANWYNYRRQQVDSATKKNAIQNGITLWNDWERKSKKVYEKAYSDLCEIGEIAAACKIKELVCDVDGELKNADRLAIKLETIGYDLNTITLLQDELHEKYKKKCKEIGVDIC